MLLVADYNQIELRCIAHLADDPGLIEAFTSGAGHPQRHGVAGVRRRARPTSRSTSARRRRWCRYGLAYGMESYGLGQRLNIPTEEAAVILDAYFVAFPNVKAYMDAHRRRGPQARLHRDAVRPPPPDPRAAQRATSGSARRASARR